jgi:hypothetical protein
MLAEIERAALEVFGGKTDEEQKVAAQIKQYVEELSAILEAESSDAPSADAQWAIQSSQATDDNVASLLYKFEQYLESVLAGRVARGRPPMATAEE